MNILFITLAEINSINEGGIYQDLLQKFRSEGHDITIVTPVERRKGTASYLIEEDAVSILRVRTFNIQKTSRVEKGIGTLAIEYQFLSAMKKHLKTKFFDLLLYSTPPITFVSVIEFFKKRDGAKSYLLLKDIFPQNAVDLKMLKRGGWLHSYFVRKEKRLYQISDTIGCMSAANVDFILRHNPEVSRNKVEVNPNSIRPNVFAYSREQKIAVRKKYKIPLDKKVFVFGGNLGKPQGLDFLLETIKETKLCEAFFLVVGNGVEFMKIHDWFEINEPINAKLLGHLPKEEYNILLSACDIGLIFLDRNFSIPNFPSRLLSYLEMNMPVIAATDPSTDIGEILENSGSGYKVLAGRQQEMQTVLKTILSDDLQKLGENARTLLLSEYTVDKSYDLITKRL